MDAPWADLEALKRTLTDTHERTAPDHEDEDPARFLRGFVEHYIQGRALTMLPRQRLDQLQAAVDDVLEDGIPGDLIETGAWRGGATILMRAVLAARGVSDRRVWVADSFQGLPQPDAESFPLEARAHQSRTMVEVYEHFAVSEDEVRANFERFGLLDEQVRFLPGWFEQTLPGAPIEHLALMRLDGDYYASTLQALESLYPRLSPGGYVIVDDYGERGWTYCARAVDEFRERVGAREPLVSVDSKCVYWRRAD